MTRTFYPVGQGAFFTEVFILNDKDDKEQDCFTVVYDCGSLSGKSILVNNIDRAFGFLKPRKIDYLFLSHLDTDHVNGVEYLIDEGVLDSKTVIVLPFYNNHQVELFEVYKSKDYSHLFSTLKDYRFNRIVFAPSVTDDRSEDRVTLDMLELKDSLGGMENYYNKEKNKFSYPYGGETIEIMGLTGLLLLPNSVLMFDKVWEYIPFTMNDTASMDFFRKISESEIVNPNDLEDIRNNVFKNGSRNNRKLKELRKKYNEVGKPWNGTRINANSLVVLSQAEKTVQSLVRLPADIIRGIFHDENYSYYFPGYLKSEDYAACVYTGDLNLKSNYDFVLFEEKIQRHLQDRRSTLLQIPHHGSAGSYNERIASGISKACFTNFDTSKRIFNKSLLFDFVNINKPLFMVTEDYDSTFVQEVFL